jgi:hypothetical protein
MGADDRYRLAPVRDTRLRDERQRKDDLAARVGDADATEARLAAITERVGLARGRLDQARVGRNALDSTGAAHLVLAERVVDRRRRELEHALDDERRMARAHDDTLGAVDDARDKLATARADREVIERHFARWREDKKRLAERRGD